VSNLLSETIDVLKQYNKDQVCVVWVGSKDGNYKIDWKQFEEIANIEYNDGFGSQRIAKDLVVVGTDWWLERSEYDGSEWWDFNTLPKSEENSKGFTTICNGDNWATIEEMNRQGGKYGK